MYLSQHAIYLLLCYRARSRVWLCRFAASLPYVTQDNTPPGPIIKARLLRTEKSASPEKGAVRNIRLLSENVLFGIRIVLIAEGYRVSHTVSRSVVAPVAYAAMPAFALRVE